MVGLLALHCMHCTALHCTAGGCGAPRSTLCAVACSGGKEKHGELRLFVGESLGLDGPLRHPEAARLADALEPAALGNLIASTEELQVSPQPESGNEGMKAKYLRWCCSVSLHCLGATLRE